MKTNKRDYRDDRGSILIMAMIFATIAAIGIGSYIRLAATEMRMANTQFYSNASLNLAEAGIEEALYAINRKEWSGQGWGTGPTSQDREKRFENVDLGAGANGEFIVRVLGYRSGDPTVIAEGRVFSSGGRMISKQIETQLRRRSPFANGITSRYGIILKGNNVFIASYISSDPSGVLRDNGSIASVLVVDEAIDIGNAEIRGWVATGGGDPRWRPNATVGSFDTPNGVVDPEHISKDFTSSFPETEVPSPELVPLVYSNELSEIGDPLFHQYWIADSVHRSGAGSELRIRGHVTMVVDSNFTIGGNGGVVIEEGASLTLYVGGNVSVAGNGIVNDPGTPRSLQIYGYGDAISDWSLGGTANLFAAVYAPNARIDIRGTSEFRGAVVGYQVELNGNTYFLYDEDLADLFTEERYAMARWRELYGSDRHSL